MSTMNLDFDFTQAKHFLLDWGSRVDSNCKLVPITVDENQDGWVTFRYIKGDRADCVDGAEMSKILTANEARRALMTFNDVQEARRNARSLAGAAKKTKENFLVSLYKKDRDIFDLDTVDGEEE